MNDETNYCQDVFGIFSWKIQGWR